jgi:NADPH2:quinone reductase
VTVRGIEQVQLQPDEHVQLAARALSEMAAGHMKPVIGEVFPLEHAADAHTAIEARAAVGKTLLAP